MQSLSDIRLRRKRTRKRLVMSQRRYEDACNRIADANVTFGDKGGAALYRLLRHGRCEHFRYRLRRKRTRKKVVATVSRCECVYKRTGRAERAFLR